MQLIILDAAYQAVKFYNYSIKKNFIEPPFKPFITEEAITEESEEIEKFLDIKNTHHSDDSLEKASEEINKIDNYKPVTPPALPKKSATLPQKPQLYPKPKVLPPPPKIQQIHKVLEDLRIIDDEKFEDTTKSISNKNNFNDHDKVKSLILPPKSIPNENNVTTPSNTDTFIINNDNNAASDTDLVLRPKDPNNTRVPKSDEQVYEELRKICNLDDPYKRYEKTKEVGKGASGVVFIASDLETSHKVAIKTIDLKNQSSKELILNEIRVLKDFNHKNLVNFLDAYFLEEPENQLWVILNLIMILLLVSNHSFCRLFLSTWTAGH